MQKFKVFYFGNPYIKEDSLAIKIAEKIKNDFPELDFKHIQNTFELIDEDLSNSLILDVANSVEKVTLLGTENLNYSSLSTTHDFDLGFFLKLTDRKANIIAIPLNSSIETSIAEVKKAINQFLSSQHSKNG